MTQIAIQIPDELKTFIDQSVETGVYHDAGEFLTKVLYEFKNRNQKAKLAALRWEIEVGIEQAERGKFVEFDAGQIIREWHARAAA